MVARIVIGSVVGILCSCTCLVSQDHRVCDTEVLVQTEKHLGHLSDEDWAAFFGVIAPICKGDSRFMGWVNDLLYKTLESQPSQFMQVFEELPRLTQRMILDELSEPGHPGLDPARTYDFARDAPGPTVSRQRILQALTKAGCHCETEIIE